MEPISVTMLGRFDIFADGKSALAYLGNAAKSTLLLKYILLNRGKPLATAELISIFWAEPDKSANPENALKTMISRIRSGLAKASPRLKGCILSEKKSYTWNPALECVIDVFRFEELARQLVEAEQLDEKTRKKYIQALSLYGGDLAYPSADEDWIVSRSLYLHHLYLKVVSRFIELLKADLDFETVIHACRIALEFDAFDESLNLELMNALKESGQGNEALMQYRHITSAYYKYLGIEPSERLMHFYRSLIKADLSAEADIAIIRQGLRDGAGEESAAFVCDYSIFRDIYQLQLRNLERQKNRIFLSLITVSGLPDPDPPVLDSVMRELLEILKTCLRKGDTIARYSTTQYAVLLPMVNHFGGQIVMNRIEKMFYKKYADSGVGIHIQFGGAEHGDPSPLHRTQGIAEPRPKA